MATHKSANTLNYSKANDEGFFVIIWAGDEAENGD